MIINGQQQTQISIADRAFLYGDGCFTTMALKQGHIEFFDAHIQRLKLACDKLAIQFDKWDELIGNTFDAIKDCVLPHDDRVVKIIISRGEGGRGYGTIGVSKANYFITLHPIPAHYISWQQQGIKLTVSQIQLSKQPLLAGIKHLNRLEQVLVKQHLQTLSFDDVIVCDTDKNIVETSAGNVFWYQNEQWYTADLTESGVEGVMRNQILHELQSVGKAYQVVKYQIQALIEAEEVFVCNSLMNIVPVKKLQVPDWNHSIHYQTVQTSALQQVMMLKAEKQRKAVS